MILERSITTPMERRPKSVNQHPTEAEMLITSWEAGRRYAIDHPDLAEAAGRGELVVLPFKGGVDKPAKTGKVGTLFYLAMWQGLRGEDLKIDTDSRPMMTCPRHGRTVTFTGRYGEYANA